MIDVMLDIETMGNNSNAPVVSIGACFFNPVTGEVGRTFENFISLEDSSKHGKIDASTVLWWMSQNELARSKVIKGSKTLEDALLSFNIFISSAGSDVKVWGNGSSFDCTILSNAYKNLEQDPPWYFWNERDVRTVVDIGESVLGIYPKRDIKFDGIPHSPLDDAKHQVKYVSTILKKLKEGV